MKENQRDGFRERGGGAGALCEGSPEPVMPRRERAKPAAGPISLEGTGARRETVGPLLADWSLLMRLAVTSFTLRSHPQVILFSRSSISFKSSFLFPSMIYISVSFFDPSLSYSIHIQDFLFFTHLLLSLILRSFRIPFPSSSFSLNPSFDHSSMLPLNLRLKPLNLLRNLFNHSYQVLFFLSCPIFPQKI